MFPGLTFGYWLTLHGLVTVVAVLLYIVTSRLLHQRRQPSAAIAWVLFILLMPYVALPAFWTFGSRKLARPRTRAGFAPALQDTASSWAAGTAMALGQPPPAAYRELNLHTDGSAALAALRHHIDVATRSIDICTFIIGNDALGSEVIERLSAKARSGVRVRLLLDGVGRILGGRPRLAPLAAAGADVKLFVPPLHSPLKGRTNLRNHRKLLIADAGTDAQRVWSGGRNLAGDYFEGGAGGPAWHDLSFDARGALVDQAAQLFEHDWAFAHGRKLQWPAPGPQIAAQGAQLLASGPDQAEDTVHALLASAAYRAEQRLLLCTPYFVPDDALLMAICLAARRGVQVDLLLPARSNHRISDLARRRALRTLSAAGAKIWLVPHMLHAKLVVVDDVLALNGTANLDSRSLFLNYELMFAFHGPHTTGAFADWFERERGLATQHVPSRPGLAGDMLDGLVLWMGFQL